MWSEIRHSLLGDESVSSLVCVHCDELQAEYWRRDASGGWNLDSTGSAFIGKNGLGKVVEGDLKTPEGEFRALMAFGVGPDPGTALPYLALKDTTIACDSDCEYYNRIVDMSLIPAVDSTGRAVSGERMASIMPEYEYGIVLDYNRENVYPIGSAIFFHCKGRNAWTGGCVAVDRDFIERVLRTCGPGLVFCIH